MQKENGKIRSEYLLAALMCIAVALFLTILIVLNSCDVNEPEGSDSSEASSSASVESSEPVSSEESVPVTIVRVEVPSADVKKGLLVLTALPEDGSTSSDEDTAGGSLINLYSSNAKKYASEAEHPYGYSGVKLELREDAWKALNAMVEAFHTAKGKTRLMVDKSYVQNASSLSDRTVEADLTTGRAVLLSVYPADPDGDYLGSGKFLWLADNCTNYGYILRYPAEKAPSTHVNGSNRLFRYVGYEHAAYMGKYHLCLEEYLETLRAYSAESPLLVTYTDESGNERSCEIYFVAVSGEGTIVLPIRGGEGENISFSGNGSDGIIVTRYLD